MYIKGSIRYEQSCEDIASNLHADNTYQYPSRQIQKHVRSLPSRKRI